MILPGAPLLHPHGHGLAHKITSVEIGGQDPIPVGPLQVEEEDPVLDARVAHRDIDWTQAVLDLRHGDLKLGPLRSVFHAMQPLSLARPSFRAVWSGISSSLLFPKASALRCHPSDSGHASIIRRQTECPFSTNPTITIEPFPDTPQC